MLNPLNSVNTFILGVMYIVNQLVKAVFVYPAHFTVKKKKTRGFLK